jgi:hypothetical protein
MADGAWAGEGSIFGSRWGRVLRDSRGTPSALSVAGTHAPQPQPFQASAFSPQKRPESRCRNVRSLIAVPAPITITRIGEDFSVALQIEECTASTPDTIDGSNVDAAPTI